MRIGFIVFGAFVFFVTGFVMVAPESAESSHSRCKTFRASHNGTDMLNPNGGAVETAKNKLLRSIEFWRQEKRIKRVRIGKIKTKCGEWYIMYLLPHHTCTARARVCR